MNQVIIYAHMTTLKFIVLFVTITTLSHCTSHEKQTEEKSEYKKELSTKLYAIRNEDSLKVILQEFIEKNDDLGKMIVYRQLGSRQRENARFSDAINSHQKGLEIALKLNDTIEIVQAMNNLGTNFRRIGALSEASQYHYQALRYAEAWSGLDTSVGTKNRVVSLNGIGNIRVSL